MCLLRACVLRTSHAVIAFFLGSTVLPFLPMQFILDAVLPVHDVWYTWLNRTMHQVLERHPPPRFLTANFVTYARTLLIVPCLHLWSQGWALVPALLVLLVDMGDLLDGVLARWWAQRNGPAKAAPCQSLHVRRVELQWGAYIDAVMDKVFAVPVWVYGLGAVDTVVGRLILWTLIIVETFRCAPSPPPCLVVPRSPAAARH